MTPREFLEKRLPELRHRRRELTTRMRIIGLLPREQTELNILENQICKIENLLRKPSDGSA